MIHLQQCKKAEPHKICKKNYSKQQTCVLRFQIQKIFQTLIVHMNWFERKIQTTNLTWFIPN